MTDVREDALHWVNEAERRMNDAVKAHRNADNWDEPLYGDWDNNQPSYEEWIAEAFNNARAALASDGWPAPRPIETAPKDGTPFLGWGWGRYGSCAWCPKVGAWEWEGGMYEERSPEYPEYSGPILWWPLPPAPERSEPESLGDILARKMKERSDG